MEIKRLSTASQDESTRAAKEVMQEGLIGCIEGAPPAWMLAASDPPAVTLPWLDDLLSKQDTYRAGTLTIFCYAVGTGALKDMQAHDLVMSLYGGMSKGERTRIKTRVRTAMASQAAIEGRFLGRRPPYGYLLGDAGPHPNPSKAANGQHLRRLEVDPIAAPVVQRIFDEFCAGSGLQIIALGLNRDGIHSPSDHDPARNPHRSTGHGRWAKTAVRAIIANPR